MLSIKVVVGLLLVDEAGDFREALFYPLEEARELLGKEGGNLKGSRFA